MRQGLQPTTGEDEKAMGTASPSGPPRDLVGYGARPPQLEWPGGARLAVSFILHVVEGSERSIADGDDTREPGGPPTLSLRDRDLGVESQFEYGARVGVWRLLSIFEEAGLPCTIAASASALQRNPALAAAIRNSGHDVLAHGLRWEDVRGLSRAQERDHIGKAVALFEDLLGKRPIGWHCRYGASVHTRELLVEEGGFLYDCDAYNDDFPYTVQVGARRHLVIPHSLAVNDQKFDWGAFGSPVAFERQVTATFDQFYDEGAKTPKLMSIGLHPRISGHAARAQAVAKFLDHAAAHQGVWFAGRDAIARHCHARLNGSAGHDA